MTTAIPHQPDPCSRTVREDRRVTWLFAFLFLPIAVVPVVAWATTVMFNPDLKPFEPAAFATAFPFLGITTGVASLGSAIVLTVPRFAEWFGLPSWSKETDERDRHTFYKAVTFSYLVTNVAIIVAIVVAAYASTVVMATLLTVLLVGNATFYLSYIVLSRRT